VKTYEVFLKKPGKEPFELAVLLARDSYVRRAEGEEVWLVDRANVLTLSPELIAPNADKPHRHNDGRYLAERRRALRGKS
jgi:1,2-phenylacetyl-CoA epoxidase PaaB subunit